MGPPQNTRFALATVFLQKLQSRRVGGGGDVPVEVPVKNLDLGQGRELNMAVSHSEVDPAPGRNIEPASGSRCVRARGSATVSRDHDPCHFGANHLATGAEV